MTNLDNGEMVKSIKNDTKINIAEPVTTDDFKTLWSLDREGDYKYKNIYKTGLPRNSHDEISNR